MNTVKVRLRKPRRVHTFLCGDLDLRRNEPCVVQSDRGQEWGVCVLPPEPIPRDMEKRYPMRVVRKATHEDEDTHRWLIQEERRAWEVGSKRISKRDLPMKLVDCEYTFDKKKVIFYFTADDRVDFRELVRDLAHELRSRIELRHIQVRDEAKMVGGIGSCGLELCCTTWLNEFKPISMRMAKKQNLSLNPTKISGQCGRLLCCLSYENEQYETMKRLAKKKKDMPPPVLQSPTMKARAALESGPTGAEWVDSPQSEQTRPDRERSREPREDRPREPRREGRPDAPPSQQAQSRPEGGEGKRRKPRRRKRGPRPDGPAN